MTASAVELDSRQERYQWALRYGLLVALFFALFFLLACAAGLFTTAARAVAVVCLALYLAANRIGARLLRAGVRFERVAFGGMLAVALLMTTCVWVTSAVSSPLLILYGPMAAVAGVYLPFRRGALAGAVTAALLAGLFLLEYAGLVPHVPLFADGSDPGLQHRLGFALVTPFGVLVKMSAIALGTDYLTAKVHEQERSLAAQEEERWAALGRFSAIVAHEVKNPLTGIRGAAALIERQAGGDGVRLAGVIREEVDRLDRLVAQYLRFARPPRVEPQPVALDAVVKKAIGVLAMARPDADLRLRYEPAAPLRAQADPDKLQEAILNLLQNASDALGGRGEIVVDTRARDGWVEIAVRDSGPGIAADALEHLFEPFFTTRPSGSGLGLSVVRQIAEAHGGAVAAANRPGGGAEFTLRLREAPE